MTGSVVRVKVLCHSCGRLICRIADTSQGVTYTPNLGTTGAVAALDARAVFCPEHGVPDLHEGQIAGAEADLAMARQDGRIHTFHATVSRTWKRRD